jgi:hypothetical protein
VKGPGITVTCDCGEVRVLPYGVRWKCERCAREWNTGQIPEADYRELARAVRRYEVEAIVLPVVLAAIFAPLIVFVDFRLGITGLFLFFVWAFLLRPRRRRSLVARVLNGARWQLRPE